LIYDKQRYISEYDITKYYDDILNWNESISRVFGNTSTNNQ